MGSFRNPNKRGRFSIGEISETRLNKKLHILDRSSDKSSRECRVCSDRKNGNRRETNFYCRTCEDHPFMLIGACFEKYHTLKNYKSFFVGLNE